MSPSRPTSGAGVEASNTTAIVGSSTAMGPISTGFWGSLMTSPICCLDADHGHNVASMGLGNLSLAQVLEGVGLRMVALC